jgi:hypothetical protein
MTDNQRKDGEIVVKLAQEEREQEHRGLRPLGAVMHVRARAAGGQRKYAEAWPEISDGRLTSRWGLYCDEGAALGGADSAPPPLVYFATAAAF